ncbi:hypothetical protein Tco_0622808 [Tanacetum coccineum]
MARQCTQPKRPRNAAWFKDKAMLAEALEAGQILDEEQLAFLADPEVPNGQAVQTTIRNNVAFQTENFDTYDSDCDDVSNAKAVLMANISNYGSDVISKVPYSASYHYDMDNQSVHAMQDFEQTSIAAVQDTNLQAQQDSMILFVIEQMSEQMINHVNNWENANKEKNNKPVTAELERYKKKVKTFEQRLNVDLSCRENMIDSQMDDMIKEKLALKEQLDSLEQNLSKQIKKKNLYCKHSLVISSEHVVMLVIDDDETLILEEVKLSAEQAFWFHMSNPTTESSDTSPVKVDVPRELPNVSLVNENLKKLKFHLAKFDKVVKIRTTSDALTEDMLLTVMNSMSLNGESVNVEMQRSESCDKYFNLDDELFKTQNAHNDLLKKYFENNNLKAQLQDKDTTICKLKENIKSMRENNKEENVNRDRRKLETINEQLEIFDPIKKTRKEHCDSLIDKLNLKSVENEDLKAQIQDKGIVEQAKVKQPLDNALDFAYLAGSLAEGSVPGKDPEGSGRLTCHDVSGGSLAVTRSRGSVLELLSHAPPAEKTEMPLVGLGL